ncbi:DUF2163 domain-containing protein [Nitratireductor sp. OM-1]|uniref:DUF2163 domain-containing protein n=1 Tax=Nitratireductor sp. OM-1 TaxID=1756988 RepID=UPI000DDCFF0D|nr:DUF2163 domain-containing protein [Nitratireductor sp. OM-1]
MKRINPTLFDQLKERTTHIVLGWLLERTDGLKLGFTSGDIPFEIDGLRYEPSNAFSGMAVSSKTNLSVDNTSAKALVSDKITDWDLQAGLWDNAFIRMFWVNPMDPQGVVPIRGGRLGEVKIRNGEFECEVRSPFQKLQQPFGEFYTLECSATLGDHRCLVWLEAEEWRPNERYIAKAGADAGIGSYVKPAVQTGFWYQCVAAQGEQAAVTSNPNANLATGDWAQSDTMLSFLNASGPAGLFKMLFEMMRIKSGDVLVDENSDPAVRMMASVMDRQQGVTTEGEEVFGSSYYQPDLTQSGQLVNSQAYLTPTKEGKVPLSAPAGVQPLTITNGSASVRYALGWSGSVEPHWPQQPGAEVVDSQLVWKCIRARRLVGQVTAVFSRSHFTDRDRIEPMDYWRYGVVEWLTGANKGIKVEVRDYGQTNGGGFALLEQMPGEIRPGDQYEVVVGCAKTRTACRAFDNIHNFRGFPDMPTEEKALATANITSKGGQKKQDSGGS